MSDGKQYRIEIDLPEALTPRQIAGILHRVPNDVFGDGSWTEFKKVYESQENCDIPSRGMPEWIVAGGMAPRVAFTYSDKHRPVARPNNKFSMGVYRDQDPYICLFFGNELNEHVVEFTGTKVEKVGMGYPNGETDMTNLYKLKEWFEGEIVKGSEQKSSDRLVHV